MGTLIKSSFIRISNFSETSVEIYANTLYEAKLITTELYKKYYTISIYNPYIVNPPISQIWIRGYSRKKSRVYGVIYDSPGSIQQIGVLYSGDSRILNTQSITICLQLSPGEFEDFLNYLLSIAKRRSFKVIELVGRGFETKFKLLG